MHEAAVGLVALVEVLLPDPSLPHRVALVLLRRVVDEIDERRRRAGLLTSTGPHRADGTIEVEDDPDLVGFHPLVGGAEVVPIEERHARWRQRVLGLVDQAVGQPHASERRRVLPEALLQRPARTARSAATWGTVAVEARGATETELIEVAVRRRRGVGVLRRHGRILEGLRGVRLRQVQRGGQHEQGDEHARQDREERGVAAGEGGRVLAASAASAASAAVRGSVVSSSPIRASRPPVSTLVTSRNRTLIARFGALQPLSCPGNANRSSCTNWTDQTSFCMIRELPERATAPGRASELAGIARVRHEQGPARGSPGSGPPIRG